MVKIVLILLYLLPLLLTPPTDERINPLHRFISLSIRRMAFGPPGAEAEGHKQDSFEDWILKCLRTIVLQEFVKSLLTVRGPGGYSDL